MRKLKTMHQTYRHLPMIDIPAVRWLATICIFFFCLAGPAHDGHVPYEVWVGGNSDAPTRLVKKKNKSEFLKVWRRLSARGWRLIDLEMKKSEETTRWAGVFKQGNGEHYLLTDLEWHQLSAKQQELKDRLHVTDLEVTTGPNGEPRFSGAWIAGARDQELRKGLSKNELEQTNLAMRHQHLFPVDLEIYEEDGQPRYAGIWERGVEETTLVFGENWSSFHCTYHRMGRQGNRLIDFEAFLPNGSPLEHRATYMGIWRAGQGVDALQIRTNVQAYEKRPDKFGVLIDFEWMEENGHIESKHPLPPNCFNSGRPITASSRTEIGENGRTRVTSKNITEDSILKPTHSHSGTLHSGGSGGGT